MKKADSYDKLRGGYYTPEVVARELATFAITNAKDTVLEPSCGDGACLIAAEQRLLDLGSDKKSLSSQIFGFEIDPNEAGKAAARTDASIEVTDFFSASRDCLGKYDAVIGNPPFVRYQNVAENTRMLAFAQMREEGLHPNRLSNLWLPFLTVSSQCLKPTGRLAMVIPAELMQVDYAKETRKWLLAHFDRVTVVTFKKLVFDGVQQDVILLLGEKISEDKGFRFLELTSVDNLHQLQAKIHTADTKHVINDDAKWLRYYLTEAELELLQKLEYDIPIPKADQLMDINVGLVTGQNDYFLLSKADVDYWNLQDCVTPIVSRADRTQGLIFTYDDFSAALDAGKKVYLFNPPETDFEDLPDSARQYILFGQNKGYNLTYKCRIRKTWYNVPKAWNPEAFMIRQANSSTRIILNSANALNTDTLHKVRFKAGVSSKSIVTAFQNSFTLLLSETVGRGYGGGVLTFEPSEARRLLIPLESAEKLDFDQLDSMQRKKNIDQLVNYTDSIILKDGIGLDNRDIQLLNTGWRKLRDRRLRRN